MRGTIRIAAAETFTEDLLPNAMMKLQAAFPHVNYTLISGDNQRITNELIPRGRVQPVYMMEFIEIVKGELSEYLRANRQGSWM